MADAQATGTITNEDPLQAPWLARFGRAVAAETVDALGDHIERRAQARSESGDADLLLLTSFLMSSAGGYGVAGYGIGHGGARYGADGYGADVIGGGAGYPHAGAGSPAGMAGPRHTAGPGAMPMMGGGMPMGTVNGGMPMMGGTPTGLDGSGETNYHLPAGSLFVPGGAGGRAGYARRPGTSRAPAARCRCTDGCGWASSGPTASSAGCWPAWPSPTDGARAP